MCDYSLNEFKNRLAVKGETLIVHQFMTGSRGLVSPADPAFLGANPRMVCAVCVPPGTRVRMAQNSLFLRDGVFTQRSAEAGRYRDAILFDDTSEYVSMQSLLSGTQVCITSDVESPVEAEPEMVPVSSQVPAAA